VITATIYLPADVAGNVVLGLLMAYVGIALAVWIIDHIPLIGG
jgi:hypothetical protein